MSDSESLSLRDWLLETGEGVSRLQREAEESVALHFEADGQKVARYVYSLGVPWGDVEDVLQEVFLALHRHLVLGGARLHLRGWIFRVAQNLSRKHLRRERRRRARDGESAYVSRQRAAREDPEREVIERQRYIRLVRGFQELSAQDRQCLFLRFEGLRYREISTVLGISLGSVANSIARSLQKLEKVDGK